MQLAQLIYVVSHGETESNVKGVINDKNINTTLTNIGKTQAIKTGKYFNSKNITDVHIYSSPSIRAVQTAQLIANELNINKSKINTDDRINEMSYGLLSGTRKGDKINDEYKKECDKMPKDPIDYMLELPAFDKKIVKKYKVESDKHIQDRVTNFFKSLPNKPKHIIIVTHGGIMTYIIRCLFNILQARVVLGDLTSGPNCCIMCIKNEKNKYELLTAPNTLHL